MQRGRSRAPAADTLESEAERLAAKAKRSEVLFPPIVRAGAWIWVALSVPFTTITALFVHSQASYLFVVIYMASGAYTLPALIIGFVAVRRGVAEDRWAYLWMQLGLALTFTIGLSTLIGLATGWRFANPLALPAVFVAGCAHMVGLIMLVRRRSGRRSLSVDIIEWLAATLAICAPLAVLWGPSVFEARQSWFTVPCALMLVFVLSGCYWGMVLFVRLGPGRGVFELSAVGLAILGAVDVCLQIAQGVSGFTLPAAPLVFIHALCFSQYLMIPINLPLLLRRGLATMPLRNQVRGAEFGTFVSLVGLGGLLLATWSVADERPWTIPFTLGVVTVLFVLAGLRQLAVVGETRRLHRLVEEASDERRHLLTQLLERNVHDRRLFAGQLYEQAVQAYTSLTLLAKSGGAGAPADGSSAAARATALVGDDLHRHAESVRELVQAIRPLEGSIDRRHRLATPLRAYLTTVYGDQPAPRLTFEIADELSLDWISETVLLQIAQEALHNVWRHSEAASVGVRIAAEEDTVALRVVDDGRGFDVATVPEGTGIAVMRASAAAVGGTLAVESLPLGGTTVTARLLPGGPPPAGPPSKPKPSGRSLRLVPTVTDADTTGTDTADEA